MRPTDELFSLPNVTWAAEAVELIFAAESRAIANHSVRSWAFARLLARHEGMADEIDDGLLFAATVLHDIGLRHDARAPVRFEIDGPTRPPSSSSPVRWPPATSTGCGRRTVHPTAPHANRIGRRVLALGSS
jgi:hypothetical protein